MLPTRRRCLLATQQSPSTSPESSRDELDAANRSLIEVKHQLQAGESLSVIGKTVEKLEEQLAYSGDASLVYAGYPSDPFAPDKSMR